MKNQVGAPLLVRRLLFLTCVMLDAALEAVEGAGLEPADVPPGEPRTCGSMLMYAFPERCLCIYLPAVCTHPLPSQRLSRRQCTLTAH